MKKREERLRWWRDVATLVALSSLLITLIFNTLGVRQSLDQAERQAAEAADAAEAARLSRLDTQVGMLTSLSTVFLETDVALARTRAGKARCDPTVRLTRDERIAIQKQLKNYDYLAWVFNQPSWSVNAAKRYWGPQMLRAYEVAIGVYQSEDVEEEMPELARFRRDATFLSRPEGCR